MKKPSQRINELAGLNGAIDYVEPINEEKPLYDKKIKDMKKEAFSLVDNAVGDLLWAIEQNIDAITGRDGNKEMKKSADLVNKLLASIKAIKE